MGVDMYVKLYEDDEKVVLMKVGKYDPWVCDSLVGDAEYIDKAIEFLNSLGDDDHELEKSIVDRIMSILMKYINAWKLKAICAAMCGYREVITEIELDDIEKEIIYV